MPSPSSSSTRPRLTIADLPDRPLLVAFDHLPLLDLFNRIPLVCPRWTGLQTKALERRTRLHLLSDPQNLYKVLPELTGTCVELSELNSGAVENGGATKKRNLKDAKDLLELDTLPIPDALTLYFAIEEYTKKAKASKTKANDSECHRLLQPNLVGWLVGKLPSITELNIAVDFFDPELVPLAIRLQEAVSALVINNDDHDGGWASQLATLRLHLWTHQRDYGAPASLADALLDAINHRMPALRELHLGPLPLKTTHLLSGETLGRLRVLFAHENRNAWLWRSLYSVQESQQLRPDLAILTRITMANITLLKRLPDDECPPPEVLDHLRSLSLETFDPMLCTVGLSAAVRLIAARFPGLRSLRLSADCLQMMSGHRGCLVERTLRRLAPLTKLTHLRLSNFLLVPKENEDSDNSDDESLLEWDPEQSEPEEDEDPNQGWVLPSLRHLSVETKISSHTDLGNALVDWAASVPRLQHLQLGFLPLFAVCAQCAGGVDRAVGFPFAIDRNGQRREFFLDDECRRQAVEPLQPCPRLVRIELGDEHRIASRTDLSGPFQWA